VRYRNKRYARDVIFPSRFDSNLLALIKQVKSSKFIPNTSHDNKFLCILKEYVDGDCPSTLRSRLASSWGLEKKQRATVPKPKKLTAVVPDIEASLPDTATDFSPELEAAIRDYLAKMRTDLVRFDRIMPNQSSSVIPVLFVEFLVDLVGRFSSQGTSAFDFSFCISYVN
jgi:hypothetical protein